MSKIVDPDETPGPALFGIQASYGYTTLKDSKQSNKFMRVFKLDPLKGTFTNSADPDEMPQNVASQQGLHCLV